MSDSDSPNTESIDIPNGTPVYGSEYNEVGIDEDGNGYVEIRPRRGEAYRFPVPAEHIETFTAIRSENAPPGPTRPEDVIPDDEVDAPDGWNGGNVEHTGGGIWCRIFRKQRDGGGRIEVLYDPIPTIQGVSAGAYGEEGDWLGEITHSNLTGDPMETQAVTAAHDLIEEIDNGEYDDEIAELYED